MSRSLVQFKDILEDRRQETSNFMFYSRRYEPLIVAAKHPKPLPVSHKENVRNSHKIRELIQLLSIQHNIPVAELEHRVKIILDEIGFDRRPKVIGWAGLVATKILLRVCSGIHVNVDSFNLVKSHMGSLPIIYLPSHRSYADFILMAYLLNALNVILPPIVAGMDFHGMTGVGSLLRNAGAFFMRRSYNDDVLYWHTFKEYVHNIITRGDAGLEFFLEGTRSRSSKSLPPKFGVLSMALRAFFTCEVPDILFVPINISYDRIMEERLFSYEMLGVPKPKETTSRFLKSLSIINDHYGNIYVDFGKPISALEYFGSKIERSSHAMKPLHMQQLNSEERTEISNLAEDVVHAQQKLCVITTFNLIAVILNNNLAMRRSIMRVEELIKEAMWLKGVMEKFGAFTSLQYPRKDVETALEMHSNLVCVDDQANVTLTQNNDVMDKVDHARLKGYALSDRTINTSVPFIMLQIYVNPTLHYLANQAILVTIVNKHKDLSKDKLYDGYKFLRSILSTEFVFSDKLTDANFESNLQHLLELQVLQELRGSYSLYKNEKLGEVLLNVLLPFLYSYYVACYVLNALGAGEHGEKHILSAVQENMEPLIFAKEVFVHPYCLSLDTMSACLQNLVKLKILKKTRRVGEFVYDIKQVELFSVTEELGNYIPSQYSEAVEMPTSFLKNKL